MPASKKGAKGRASTGTKAAASARKSGGGNAAPKKAATKKAATKKATPRKAPATRGARPVAVRPAGVAPAGTEGAGPLSITGLAPYEPKKGEPYMSDAQTEHFRKILLEWKRQLMEETERTVHHMQDEAANFPDPNDRATQEEEFSLELRTRDRERKLVKKINEALARIETGEYGYCEACGVEIGIRRLEARPTATLCIDCKTLDEIREKQMSAS